MVKNDNSRSQPERSGQRKMSKGTEKQDFLQTVLYARISVDRPDENSIANQLREMREYAAAMGWTIVGEYFDRGKSAYDLTVEREGFNAAMEMVESKRANRLLVWKLDRMTRNARGFVKINERLENAGAVFASKVEPWFDTSSPIGYALVLLMVALGQMEAEGIQERSLSWHKGRREDGLPPIGARPFGYMRLGPNQLVPNPFEAGIVEEIADRIIRGESIRGIARDLTARGIPSVKGKAWNHASIRSMFKSPTIAGMFKRDGELVESDKWQAIIEPATWRLVREVMDDPTRAASIPASRGKLAYLLPNFLTCGKCGIGTLITERHSSGRRYRCPLCWNGIAGDTADDTVSAWILENTSEGQWQSMLTQGRGHDPIVIDDIRERINSAWADYYGTDENHRPSKTVFDGIIAGLTAQLDAAENEPSIKLPAVDSLHHGWATMSNDDKRLVIAARVESITIHPHGKGCVGRDRVVIDAA